MVHIMLHGLIALVPLNGDNGQLNHMAALLLDGGQPRDLQCFVPHQAKISFTTSNDECVAAGCSVNSDLCVCEINEFREIQLTPDVQPAARPLGASVENSLPFDQSKATSFAYVGNLAGLGQKIKPELLDFGSVPSPNPLIARMRFPFEVANACSLATRRDEGGDNVHPLNFRKLGDLEQPNEKSQALAQQLVATYTLPDDGTGSPKLTLTLARPGEPTSAHLVLKPGPHGYAILLENRRAYELLPGDPCDDGIARDFSLYYDLAENPLAQQDRLIPQVKYTRWKSATELLAPECQGMKEPMSRPVCPIGAYYPGSGAVQ
jgi:hypothetical protein